MRWEHAPSRYPGPLVVVMEPLDFRDLDHLSTLWSGLRTVHRQGYVRVPMMIIRHVAREHALEVPFVEDHDMV
jgi:hypothetical protein